MNSQAMLEHAKVIWLIKISFQINQRHCTHILYSNMQRSSNWSEHPSWNIRGTVLTCYVGTCKGHPTDQKIQTSFLRNQRHSTHKLCWNMQWSFEWSEHLFWDIRGTVLTFYVETCNGHLTDQNIFYEKSKALHSQTMLEHTKVIWLIRTFFLGNQRLCTHILYWNMQKSFDWSEDSFWEIRGSSLTFYIGTCKGHLTDQNIPSETMDLLSMLEHAKSFD